MIEVYCIRGNGDKEMNTVEDSLLTSTASAVLRGKYEIDKQWYLVHSQSLEVPFKKTADSTMLMDDDIISLSDSVLGLSGKRKVNTITLSGSHSDVLMVLGTSNFEEYL